MPLSMLSGLTMERAVRTAIATPTMMPPISSAWASQVMWRVERRGQRGRIAIHQRLVGDDAAGTAAVSPWFAVDQPGEAGRPGGSASVLEDRQRFIPGTRRSEAPRSWYR